MRGTHPRQVSRFGVRTLCEVLAYTFYSTQVTRSGPTRFLGKEGATQHIRDRPLAGEEPAEPRKRFPREYIAFAIKRLAYAVVRHFSVAASVTVFFSARVHPPQEIRATVGKLRADRNNGSRWLMA
jgi:hypothetical protein